MDGFLSWMQSIPWFGWIAIVAILCGTIPSIMVAYYRHEERMEMIRKGVDPRSVRKEEMKLKDEADKL